MRCMRAKRIHYRFGRNFLPFHGMCCFNLIRYSTYQRRWKGSESAFWESHRDWRCIAVHLSSVATSPIISNMTLLMVITVQELLLRETGSVINCKTTTLTSVWYLLWKQIRIKGERGGWGGRAIKSFSFFCETFKIKIQAQCMNIVRVYVHQTWWNNIRADFVVTFKCINADDGSQEFWIQQMKLVDAGSFSLV